MRTLDVIIPTYNPDPERLGRVLDALRAQTLDVGAFGVTIIDNNSADPAVIGHTVSEHGLPETRVVRETQQGLTAARLRGFRETQAPLIVLVDDDNVLAADYLERAAELFAGDPQLGIAGGRIVPEFEVPPPAWARAFDDKLALRDDPDAHEWNPQRDSMDEYPPWAPVGAGMVQRRHTAEAWMDSLRTRSGQITDRTAESLSSSGDNDIVFAAMKSGMKLRYDPRLVLTHLIPASRVTREYLARLAYGISESWVGLLDAHGVRPWKPLSPALVPVASARAWVRCRAWAGPAEYVRWRERCGLFAGRARLR